MSVILLTKPVDVVDPVKPVLPVGPTKPVEPVDSVRCQGLLIRSTHRACAARCASGTLWAGGACVSFRTWQYSKQENFSMVCTVSIDFGYARVTTYFDDSLICYLYMISHCFFHYENGLISSFKKFNSYHF